MRAVWRAATRAAVPLPAPAKDEDEPEDLQARGAAAQRPPHC
jgi:hypothetical protein